MPHGYKASLVVDAHSKLVTNHAVGQMPGLASLDHSGLPSTYTNPQVTTQSLSHGKLITPKIKAQIWTNEYVDFNLLLGKQEAQKFVMKQSGEGLTFCREEERTKPLEGMTQWVRAFFTFVSIYSERYPAETPSLMKYGSLIFDLKNQTCKQAAIAYDELFRRQRQTTRTPWNVIHPKFYQVALASDIEYKLTSTVNKTSFRSNTFRFGSNRKEESGKICWQYNNTGACPWGSTCSYRHCCQRCRGPHSKSLCPIVARGSTRQSSGSAQPPKYSIFLPFHATGSIPNKALASVPTTLSFRK
ncbi:hypothetical protein SNE40_018163 [Patella caerulea]|uniref:C3H1-type domain-containing protein n=1 Tax=Patella caerulea TaxID=87958 RepID=A0AAN8J9I0_PATCE